MWVAGTNISAIQELIAAVVKASDRVQPGEWPAMSVVRTIYHGGYEGLGGAWREFMEWIERNNYNVTNEIWERYLLGPEFGPESGGDASDGICLPLRAESCANLPLRL